jgi:hypothetical protein
MRVMQQVSKYPVDILFASKNKSRCAICVLVTDLRTMLVNCRGTIQLFVFGRAGGIDWLKFPVYATAMIVSLNCTNAFGSYITMTTGFSVTEKSEGSALLVMAENRGDEPAYDVQFEIIVDDITLVGPRVKILEVNEKTSKEYMLADVFGSPGRYPIVIRTYYEDANGYRFTALTVGFYDYKSTVMPAVSIHGHSTEMPVDGKGQLKFVLRNDGLTGQKIDLALFLPNELSVPHEQSVIEIGPHQEKTVIYDVENYSALTNSSYQVSLVGRYDEAGSRLGVAGSAVVRIAENARLTDRPVWIWVVLGGLLPVVIVFLRLQKQ